MCLDWVDWLAIGACIWNSTCDYVALATVTSRLTM
jgi:hypothetical protein